MFMIFLLLAVAVPVKENMGMLTFSKRTKFC